MLREPCLLGLMQRFVNDAAAAPEPEWRACLAPIGAGYPSFPTS